MNNNEKKINWYLNNTIIPEKTCPLTGIPRVNCLCYTYCKYFVHKIFEEEEYFVCVKDLEQKEKGYRYEN